MKKSKEEWATYTLSINCPKEHVFLADLECIYDLVYSYKGEESTVEKYIHCEKCNKEYKL